MDCYKILNLSADASIKEIEQAYKDLSSFYNPNNNVSKLAYKKYREVEKAYKILKENKQREMYNLSIKDEEKLTLESNDKFTRVNIEDFDNVEYKRVKEDIEKYQDVVVDDIYSNYTHLKVSLPYIYYLTGSEYEISFKKEIIKESTGVCPTCLGACKVKENNKVVYCKDCLSTGKKVKKEEINIVKYVKVDEKVVDNEDQVIVEFDFFDKNDYVVNSNEIIINHQVSKDEFYSGIYFTLKSKDNYLNIEKNNFEVNKDTYIFLDKIIKINWILDKYKGKDKHGYIITNKDIIHLNVKDYTFSYSPDDVHNYKIEINDKHVVVSSLGQKGYQDINGDLILEVITLENNDDLKIFFDRKIKKMSYSLTKLKGIYNNHYFKNKKGYDYDDNYIYLPSLAYKLKFKHFTLFKLLFSLIYLMIPLVLFIIFGVSYVFFIVSFIMLITYLIGVNFLMEVKI